MKKFLLFIPVIVFFLACNALKPENVPVKLDGPEWKLAAINHKAVSQVGRAYLVFDGEDLEVKGKAFCNSISADYERMGDDQITFQEITSTKMYCDGVMDLENQMVTNLRNVKRFEIRNGMLYLSDSDNILLTFKK
jgi:heat shock protein HslJ